MTGVLPTRSTTARPLYFGEGGTLFGWYHAPTGGTPRTHAIVLCQPVGHEYMYAHRGIRHFAEAAAAQGFPVFRFDYYGTGNAQGDEHDADLVARWRRDIATAIDAAKVCSGATRVALVGLRIGGTLAALVAAERNMTRGVDADVGAVVLWQPCVKGRAFVRETKALAGAAADLAGNPVIDEETGDIEGLGFGMAPDTASALSALDLTQLSAAPAPLIHVLERDDFPLDDAFVQSLTTLGADVTREAFTGYDTFMVPPIKSHPPGDAIARGLAWLDVFDGVHPAPAGTRPTVTPFPSDVTHLTRTGEVNESAERFDDGLMFGIVTEPRHRAANGTAILLLNTGGDHHIGPHRLYTPFSRTLAAEGFLVFRFDFTGLGDSAARPGAAEGEFYSATAIDDVRAAVHFIRTKHRVERVLLVGMCSGGFYAVHAAYEQIPVDGIVSVNPQLYWREGDPMDVNPFWNANETKRIGSALLSPKYWMRALKGDVDYQHVAQVLRKRVILEARKLSTKLTRQESVTPASSAEMAAPAAPPRKSREQNVNKLLRPGVDTCFVFSHDDAGLMHLRQSLGGRLPTLERSQTFTLRVIDGAGHTFMPLRAQRTLRAVINDWIVSRYGIPPDSRALADDRPPAHELHTA